MKGCQFGVSPVNYSDSEPIGAVCANAFAYAALTLFYIANFVTNEENDRNLKFALQFAKII